MKIFVLFALYGVETTWSDANTKAIVDFFF